MNTVPHAAWPFFDEPHRRLLTDARAWAATSLADSAHPHDRNAVDQRCRDLVAALGSARNGRVTLTTTSNCQYTNA